LLITERPCEECASTSYNVKFRIGRCKIICPTRGLKPQTSDCI
jgi:hypothetical protein